MYWIDGFCRVKQDLSIYRTGFVQKLENKIPGLFQDSSRTSYIFFQDSFFVETTSPNTAYTQDFFPNRDSKHVSPSRSLYLPNFSSAYRLHTLLCFFAFRISSLQGFTSGCIQFVLHVLE